MNETDLAKLATQTQQVYERNAARFELERTKTLFEKPWLDRFLNLLPQHGKVMDLGCGTGDPIAAYITQQGHNVVGVDASQNMIQIAQRNFPDGDWRVQDMRALDLPERFDGIIGWHSFFHLTRAEQRSTLPIIIKHLRRNGALMLTVGPFEGEVAGYVDGDPVFHASLSPDGYKRILAQHGLEVVKFVPDDPDCRGATVLLAQRTTPQSTDAEPT